jgi:hypothetical protein
LPSGGSDNKGLHAYFPRMPRIWVPLLAATVWTAACQRPSTQAVPEPPEHALANLAAQHVVVLPTYAALVAPGLAWKTPSVAELRRAMDADIVSAFEERGLRKSWIFPDQLQAAYRRNSTYATDPYALAEEPLRSPALAIDQRLPEPLASQIRTMVAFHEDARLVLAPVELVVEPAGGSAGHGVLRLVLMDARQSNSRWIGSVTGDSSAAFGPAVTASVAAKLAGVVAPQ